MVRCSILWGFFYTAFDEIAISNTGVSSMLICSLMRDTAVANDYASAAYVADFDVHYRRDLPGSRQETVK